MSSTTQSSATQASATQASAQAEIIGHEKRWAALARAFARSQVPETLLMSGPAHIGKSTLVLRYAQLLLCPHSMDNQSRDMSTHAALPAPCLTCRVCHQVEVETFPDYRVYRPLVSAAGDEREWITASSDLEGSVIPFKMARLFGDEAMRRPSIGTRKVMVLLQAERMGHEAQNSLLKTFEEPARGLAIVLLCDNPDELLPTVLSRAWHLPLSLLPDQTIRDWLLLKWPQASANWIEEAVRVAAGRPGLAWREMRRLLRHADTSNGAEGTANASSSGATGAQKSGARRSAGASPKIAESNDEALPRFTRAAQLVDRIVASQPVGALGLTEEALRLARAWWEEDQVDDMARESKKSDAKVTRSALARFLDELATAYRARWTQSQIAAQNGRDAGQNSGGGRQNGGVEGNGASRNGAGRREVEAARWADGLDLIRKTRHYILRNANSNLALDVMFGRLISAWHQPPGAPQGTQAPTSSQAPRNRFS